MTSITDIPEIIATYGERSKRRVYQHVFDLIERHDVSDVIQALPDPWRERFIDCARELVDNDVPASHFMILRSYNGADDSEPDKVPVETIERLRRWIQSDGANRPPT